VIGGRWTAGPHAGTAPARGVRCGAVLGLIGAACYVYLLVEVAIGDLDRTLSFVSELSARDQPHHLLFQAFDLAAGLLIAALGLGLHRGLPAGPGRAWGWGAGSVVAFGLATAAVGLLPLDCAASARRACALNEQSGRVSLVHHAHTAASVLTTLAVIASMGLLGWAARECPGWRPLTWYAATALPLVCVLSALLAVLGLGWRREGSTTTAAHLRAVLGVGQRLELLAVAGWITVLAVCLLRSGRVPSGPGPGDEHT